MYPVGDAWVVYAFVVGGPGACGESWLPSINTDVSMYIDWILNVIRDDEARAARDRAQGGARVSNGVQNFAVCYFLLFFANLLCIGIRKLGVLPADFVW